MTTSASARLPIPNRDYSILSPRQLRVMRQRSKPPEVDRSAEIAREQGFAKHQQTQQLASLWPNTIARNRIDKQTRLQREKEAEEERQKVIDAEEKKIQKLKRQAALAEASKAEFQQRPEVRAVNSQLLQFEVEQEREMQLTFKERARIAEMKQQIADDEARAKEHEEALAREEKIRRERRERALQLARDVKKQRDEREALRTQQAETDYEEELIIAAHMRKELEMEQEAILRAKQLARQQNEENLRENQQMQSYKNRMADLEKEEDRRLRQLTIDRMDKEDEEREIAEKKKREKLLQTEKIFEAERQRLIKEQSKQKDLLDKQIAEHFEKKSKELDQIRIKQERLNEERRKDFLESLRIKAERDKRLKEKRMNRNGETPFPIDPITAKREDEIREREFRRVQSARELYNYQRQQAREKRERESAEKERARLEYQEELRKDQNDLEIAQQYARNMLARIDAENSD